VLNYARRGRVERHVEVQDTVVRIESLRFKYGEGTSAFTSPSWILSRPSSAFASSQQSRRRVDTHTLAQINHRLLTHSKQTLLGTIQIDDQQEYGRVRHNKQKGRKSVAAAALAQ